VRRTSDSASGLLESGWSTPTVHDTKGTDYNRYSEAGKGDGRSGALQDQAQLAAWATPAARDHRFANSKSYQERGGGAKGEQLNNQVVHLCGWPTATATDAVKQGEVSPRSGAMGLSETVPLAGWPTASATDGDRGGSGITQGMTGTSLTQIAAEVIAAFMEARP
jgi:hypothetical protein